jgi:DNA-binding NarL/FixJ family response regulator
MHKPLKIVIADDHELLRDGLVNFISEHSPFKVAGQAKNGIEVIELVNKLQPDIVILDIVMPVMNGLEATRILSQQHPTIPILVLSMLDDDRMMVELLEAGAQGYIFKTQTQELIEAIETVYQKRQYYCTTTDKYLLKKMAASRFDPFQNSISKYDLTDQEIKIIQLICRDIPTKQIATHLSISIHTVNAHRRNIHEKIGTTSPIGIMLYAIKKNIILIPELFVQQLPYTL